MKILTHRQLRDADKATIERQGTTSLDLMERAATAIARWIVDHVPADRKLLICCGKGGNGGDGLALARILTTGTATFEGAIGTTAATESEKSTAATESATSMTAATESATSTAASPASEACKAAVAATEISEISVEDAPPEASEATRATEYPGVEERRGRRGGRGGRGERRRVRRECAVLLAADRNEFSADARANFERLPKEVKIYDSIAECADIEPDTVIIDAMLGVGVTGEIRQPVRGIIEWINSLPNRVISIDLPSGLGAETSNGTLPESRADTAASSSSSIASSSAATATATAPEIAATTATTTAAAAETVIRAGTTLTIGLPKLELLLPDGGESAGNVIVIPIGLDEKFLAEAATPYYYITREWVNGLLKPRLKYSHKGSYGHALLVCGSASMPGAAILATGGALRSGCGLVTSHVPHSVRVALSIRHPSAMLSLDNRECFSTPPESLEKFSAIGVGPGLGRDPNTVEALGEMLKVISTIRKSTTYRSHATSITSSAYGPESFTTTPTSEENTFQKASTCDRSSLHPSSHPCQQPSSHPAASPNEENSLQSSPRLVLDADALNIIAQRPDLLQFIPGNSILTPHPGELRRLVGDWKTDAEKLEKASNLAREIRSIVIIKGAHSVICTPDGRFMFNSTGTPGMAKGGSGDVLTGLVTGLMARGYDTETASVIGVYAHGKAGEKAQKRYGAEAMNASDIADFLRIEKDLYSQPACAIFAADCVDNRSDRHKE